VIKGITHFVLSSGNVSRGWQLISCGTGFPACAYSSRVKGTKTTPPWLIMSTLSPSRRITSHRVW